MNPYRVSHIRSRIETFNNGYFTIKEVVVSQFEPHQLLHFAHPN